MRAAIILAVAAALSATTATVPAAAHVVPAEPTATAGSYHVMTLRVPHGCEGSPTTAVRVLLPPDIVSAKPRQMHGWTLEVVRAPLPAPVRTEHATVTERVAEIAWSGGNLPDEAFEAFSIMLRLPDRTGPLVFPVIQTCAQGRNAWVDVAPEGQPWGSVRYPAPVLTLTPAKPRGQ